MFDEKMLKAWQDGKELEMSLNEESWFPLVALTRVSLGYYFRVKEPPMNFTTAMEHLLAGRKVRRRSVGCVMRLDCSEYVATSEGGYVLLVRSDLLATDWEVVPDAPSN